jgi:large subunit ribosomal protein L17
MRHLKGFKQLNRTHAHRKALYKNMATALFRNERIKTTKIKAKEIQRISEKLITRAKIKNLHNIRIIAKLINDKEILMKLFNDIGPRYVNRKGGYTRVIQLGRRKGDGADTAYLELVSEQGIQRKTKKGKTADQKNKDEKETKPENKEVKQEVKEKKPAAEVKSEKVKKTEESKTEKKEESDSEKTIIKEPSPEKKEKK